MRTTQRSTVVKARTLQDSLLWTIDQTLTAMGGRCLGRWLKAPLMDLREILLRQSVVSLLVSQRPLRQGLNRSN